MIIMLAVLVAVFLALLILGGLTGRVTMRTCCTVADPHQDLRMRAAFPDAVPFPSAEPAHTSVPPVRDGEPGDARSS